MKQKMSELAAEKSYFPEITIIITAYNSANYINSCLNEIMAQTYQCFDVLVINDCSIDGTKEIIECYVHNYPDKIRLLNTPFNSGSPGLARNFALASGMIDGKYSIFFDGDDHVEVNFLEKLYHRAIDTDADITICNYCRINQETDHKIYSQLKNNVIYKPYKCSQAAFINVALWNKLIKTSLMENLRLPDLKVGEDAIFFWALCRKANVIATLGDVLFHYHVRPNSIIENIDYNSICAFALETQTLLENNKANPDYYEWLALCAFIHIGISMAIRAFDNPLIDTKIFLSNLRNYLYTNKLMSQRKFLSLSHLITHGIKGVLIWLTRISYRFHVIYMSLHIYHFIRKIFGKDFKF